MLYKLKREEYRVILARACMAVPICLSPSHNLIFHAIWSHPADGAQQPARPKILGHFNSTQTKGISNC